jgi:hypothetical protein
MKSPFNVKGIPDTTTLTNRQFVLRLLLAVGGLLLVVAQPKPHYDNHDDLSLVILIMLLWFFPQVWKNRRDDKVPALITGLAILVAATQVWHLVVGLLTYLGLVTRYQ